MDEFDQRLAALDADMETARKRAASASVFRQGVESVRGRGSCDGVEVVVDSSGVLVDVNLGRDLVEVREAILTAYQQARREAGRAVVGLAQDAFGEDDASVARLQDVYGVASGQEAPVGGQGFERGRGLLRPGGSL